MFKHSNWVALVAIALGLACLAGGGLYANRPQLGTQMHVQEVRVEMTKNGKFGARRSGYFAGAFVQVVDQNGQAVKDATVTGDFTNCTVKRGVSSKTNSSGWAILEASLTCDCVQVFTVTNVTKRGANWDQVQGSDAACLCGDCGG